MLLLSPPSAVSEGDALLAAQSRGQLSRYPWMWNGLVGCWPFIEGCGWCAHDFSGYGSHGTLTSMTPAIDWLRGPNALDFDGSNDSVEVPYAANLQPSLPLSVVLRFRADSWPGAGDHASMFCNSATGLHGAYEGVTIGYEWNSTKLFVTAGDGTGTGFNDRRSFQSLTTPATSQWYTLGAVVRSETDMSIYLNGQDDTGAASGGGGNLAYGSNSTQLAGRASEYWKEFDGRLSDVRIYDRALSASEMLAIHQAGSCALMQLRRRPTMVSGSGGLKTWLMSRSQFIGGGAA
jgi:hypothetical protein